MVKIISWLLDPTPGPNEFGIILQDGWVLPQGLGKEWGLELGMGWGSLVLGKGRGGLGLCGLK